LQESRLLTLAAHRVGERFARSRDRSRGWTRRNRCGERRVVLVVVER
jgi:hypothetical protein